MNCYMILTQSEAKYLSIEASTSTYTLHFDRSINVGEETEIWSEM